MTLKVGDKVRIIKNGVLPKYRNKEAIITELKHNGVVYLDIPSINAQHIQCFRPDKFLKKINPWRQQI